MIYDCAIVGSGVAALSAALSCVRSALKVIVFGGAGATSQIDKVENYPGVFPAISGSAFIETLKAQVQHFAPKSEPELFAQSAVTDACVFSDAFVTFIDKRDDKFFLGTAQEVVSSRTVIIATGCHHKTLGIAGEKENIGRGVSYCAQCDAPYFSNKDVAVIGGGDSALNEALYLSRIVRSVTIIVRKGRVRAQQITKDRVEHSPNIKIIYNTVLEKIERVNSDNSSNDAPSSTLTLQLRRVNKEANFLCIESDNSQDKGGDSSRDGSVLTAMKVDGVFIFVGLKANNSLVDMLPTDEAGFIITDDKMATIISGLFVAGDVRSKPLRQLITAASDGAIAANSAAEYLNAMR